MKRRSLFVYASALLSFMGIRSANAETLCSCLPPPNCDDVCSNGGNPKGDGTQECECFDQPTGSVALEDAYPVGAIYLSVVATNPADLFGGTWEALDEGRVLIGAGSNHPAGEKGGEEKHTLTTSEMPSHTHSGSTGSGGSHSHSFKVGGGGEQTSPANGTSCGWSYGHAFTSYTASSGSHSHSLSINSSGGGEAHNIMQPYLSVYMWKRIA